MQVQAGMVQSCVLYLSHCDLLFTFNSTSKENLVWAISSITFYARSPNLACRYMLGCQMKSHRYCCYIITPHQP